MNRYLLMFFSMVLFYTISLGEKGDSIIKRKAFKVNINYYGCLSCYDPSWGDNGHRVSISPSFIFKYSKRSFHELEIKELDAKKMYWYFGIRNYRSLDISLRYQYIYNFLNNKTINPYLAFASNFIFRKFKGELYELIEKNRTWTYQPALVPGVYLNLGNLFLDLSIHYGFATLEYEVREWISADNSFPYVKEKIFRDYSWFTFPDNHQKLEIKIGIGYKF